MKNSKEKKNKNSRRGTNVPPHKRNFNRNPASTSNPSPPLANVTSQTPSSPSKIRYSRRRFISHWYATSTESLAVVPYNYGGTEINFKPLTVTDKAGLVEEEEIGVLRGIVKNLARDLIKASQNTEEKEIEGVDPKLLMMEKIEIVNVQLFVMVGKIIFSGNPSACLDSIKKALANEGEFNNNEKVQKTFYSRVSEEYIREVKQLLVDNCEFESVGAKQRYHIKIIDKRQRNLNISCKCKASHDSTLELYKVEQNPLKHMVTDVSCLSKNFDLRIMLNTKRVLKNLDADVMDGINQLISAAIIDPEAKGGLRWPPGKESVDGRFFIVSIWHTKHKILSRDKIRVDLRKARRFDFTTSTGEDVNDVSFKLRGLSELLTGEHLRDGSFVDMMQEVVGLIWDNLLSLSTCTVLLMPR